MLFWTSGFAKNEGACNFFAIWLRMLILFLNDVDIQLILEFKNSFGKICPFFPKNPKHFFLPGAFQVKTKWFRMLIPFLNDADIKIISEFKDSFGKYYPVFPKNQKKWGVKSVGFWQYLFCK